MFIVDAGIRFGKRSWGRTSMGGGRRHCSVPMSSVTLKGENPTNKRSTLLQVGCLRTANSTGLSMPSNRRRMLCFLGMAQRGRRKTGRHVGNSPTSTMIMPGDARNEEMAIEYTTVTVVIFVLFPFMSCYSFISPS